MLIRVHDVIVRAIQIGGLLLLPLLLLVVVTVTIK